MRIVHAQTRTITRTFLLLTCIATVLLLHVLLPPVHAYAQQGEALLLESVSVDIWPEYDQPSVLVIYHISLADEVSLPAAMTFRIPAAAGKPHAVAWQSPDKSPFEMTYETTVVGEWIEVRFTTPAPDIQIEYYDPGMKITGSRRDFTYQWPGSLAVQNLSLQVQKPPTATSIKFTPDIGSGRAGSDGLEYYSYLAGPVSAGTPFKLTIQYDKPDESLTFSGFQEALPQQPLNSSTQGRVALDQFLPWGMGGLGLLLLAAGSFWYWKTGRVSSVNKGSGRARHAPARTRAPKPASDAEAGGGTTFCHQCGNKAAPGDAFCRICGTKLR